MKTAKLNIAQARNAGKPLALTLPKAAKQRGRRRPRRPRRGLRGKEEDEVGAEAEGALNALLLPNLTRVGREPQLKGRQPQQQ